jgi:hypothetical protein
MQEGDQIGNYPNDSLNGGTASTAGSMSDHSNVEISTKGSSINESSPSQSFMSEATNSEQTTHESTPSESGSPSNVASKKKSKTKRGRHGKKWVGKNFEQKEMLKAANSRSLPFRFLFC